MGLFSGGGGFSNVLNQINNWHPLDNIVDQPIIDPYLQGDLTAKGDVKKGSYVDKKNENLGVSDMSQAATFFAQTIASAFGLNALFGGMMGAEGADMTAGGGEVGSGYPSSAPGTGQTATGTVNALGGVEESPSLIGGGEGTPMPPAVLDTGGQSMMPAAQSPGGNIEGTNFMPSGAGPSGQGTTFVPEGSSNAPGTGAPQQQQQADGDVSPPVEQGSATNAQMDQAIRSGQESSNTGTGNQFMDFLGKNKGSLIPVGLTAASLLSQPKGSPNSGVLNEIAARQAATGAQSNQLMQPLATDTLPASQQASLDQSKDSIKAQIRAKYSKMGLSGSTMEQQELANVDTQSLVVKGQIEKQLFDAGIGAAGLSNSAASIYQQLANTTLSQDQQLRNALQRLAGSYALGSAMSSGGGGG